MEAGWSAVAHVYHALLTGTLLRVQAERGSREAADLIFRLFRRQHLATFVPGLEKLGLTGLPDAVACAQYHYLSNAIGGVRVEYMPESETKAWVRYAPPRWIWQGTALCGITSAMSTAILRGWHAHNGVTLGNPRLGFVCTKQTVDGQDGLEGYYFEYDHDLDDDERLRFSRAEEAPPFDPAKAPQLPSATWPKARLDKAARNYAMEYVRSTLIVALEMMGPDDALWLIGGAAKRIGMHFFDECRTLLGQSAPGAEGFAEFFVAMAEAEGDEARIERGPDGALTIHRRGWRLMDGEAARAPAFPIWNELWRGCLAAHDRFLSWSGAPTGPDTFVFTLARRV